jgi:hypothetical protein
MGAVLRSTLLVCAAVLICSSAHASENGKNGRNGKNGHKLPANQWVKLEEGGLGPRGGMALVYCPAVGRFLVAMGGQPRYGRGATPPYSEMNFNFRQRRWENALPKGGESWGGITGPVNAPNPGGRSGLQKGKDGILRPNLRGGYGTMVYHLYAYDAHRKKVLYGVNMEYDPVARAWARLEPKGHPGTPDLPPLASPKPSGPAWSQMCYDPVNREFLLFGGTKVCTETGAPGTWVYSPAKNEWRKLSFASQQGNSLAARARALQRRAHTVVTACRNRYYRTELAENAKKKLPELMGGILQRKEIQGLLDDVRKAAKPAGGHAKQQLAWAAEELGAALDGYGKLLAAVQTGVDAKRIAEAAALRRLLRRAATSLSSEPPPRCYSPMVFDPDSGKIVLFGGYALDCALADTWLYDPKTRSWEERRPALSPSPRLGHGLVHLPRTKRVVLVGGWVARSGVGCSRFLGSVIVPQAWSYDVGANKWSLVARWEKPKVKGGEHPAFPSPGNGPQVFAANDDDVVLTLAPGRKGPSTWACRIDATVTDSAGTAEHGVKPGAEHCADAPSQYDTKAPPPDAEKVEAELKNLPVNKWVRRSEGGLKRPTFAYCTVAYDPDRDQILTFAGGHGTWHGADVGRYSLATDRWHIDQPARIPLSFGYFCTGGSYGYDFRPWMGVHLWGGYDYDTVTSKLVLLTSMPGLTFTYDSDLGRFERPWSKLPPSGGGWATKAATTPQGIYAWSGWRRTSPGLYRLDPKAKAWVKLPVKGAKLPKPGIDNAGMTYDSKRNRLVLLDTGLKGGVVTCDLANGELKLHRPAKAEAVGKLGFLREFEYVPGADLVMDPTGNAWDPGKNEWLRLKLDLSEAFKPRRKRKGSGPARSAGTSQGFIHDSKRDLVWLVNGYQNKGVFVMKLDAARARE